MFYDLHQIAKAEGIYLTLRLWAMLSPSLVNGNSQRAHPKPETELSEDELLKRKVAWLIRALYLGEDEF